MTTATALPAVLTTDQVAHLLGVARTTVWQAARECGGIADGDGNIVVRPVRVGRALRWPSAPLLRLLGDAVTGEANGAAERPGVDDGGPT
jgi:hypothetical protein